MMLKHYYLPTVKKPKLFKGAKSFTEIEKQIEEHSDSTKDTCRGSGDYLIGE